MRLAFIHSCLEPARDGVGDYTRLLAAECARQGHPTCILALNDPFATAAELEGPIPELRLGPSLPWPERLRLARAFLDRFRPDRLSVQFVCYGWHPKGIAFGIGRRLRLDRTQLRLHRGCGIPERAIELRRIDLVEHAERVEHRHGTEVRSAPRVRRASLTRVVPVVELH